MMRTTRRMMQTNSLHERAAWPSLTTTEATAARRDLAHELGQVGPQQRAVVVRGEVDVARARAEEHGRVEVAPAEPLDRALAKRRCGTGVERVWNGIEQNGTERKEWNGME